MAAFLLSGGMHGNPEPEGLRDIIGPTVPRGTTNGLIVRGARHTHTRARARTHTERERQSTRTFPLSPLLSRTTLISPCGTQGGASWLSGATPSVRT